jgi:hypothetical protein
MFIKKATAVAAEVAEWAGVIHGKSEFTAPQYIEQPVAEISLYEDGLQCQLEPEKC